MMNRRDFLTLIPAVLGAIFARSAPAARACPQPPKPEPEPKARPWGFPLAFPAYFLEEPPKTRPSRQYYLSVIRKDG